MIRRLFVFYGLLTRAMTLGVRAVVINEEGEVYLVRHTYISGWHLPGGGVERGETLLQALHKEVHEEANIELNGGGELFHVYKNERTSRFDHVAVYVCREWTSLGPRKPDREIAESGFFALDNLPDGTTDYTRNRLKEVFEAQPASDYW